MKIFLDIETVPLGAEPVYNPMPFGGVKAPANYKDECKKKEYVLANWERLEKEHVSNEKAKYETELTEYKKGALKATRSQIVCICSIKGNEVFHSATDNEEQLLTDFSAFLHDGSRYYDYVGHNVAFDLQMLRTHATKYMLHGLKDLLTFEKFAKNINDTMQLWAGVRYDDKTKLTDIAEFLGIGNLNGNIDGSDIYDLYKAGKFNDIAAKCLNDVLMTKEVYERIS